MNELESRFARTEAAVRRWQVMTAVMIVVSAASLFFRPIGPRPPPPPPSVSGSFSEVSAKRMKVEWLEVVDDKGNTVVSIHEGAGGGIVRVTSTKPNDHNVLIMAGPHGADVKVSLERTPRQFGFLKIMDGRPYLQLYEEGDNSARNFYQAPLYSANGSIGSAFSVGPAPSTQPGP